MGTAVLMAVVAARGSDYSTATFLLEEAEGGTRLTFTQTGVPEQHYDGISQGWRDFYWTKMASSLESQ